MKKFALFDENGYKIGGYLEDMDIPEGAIEITDEEELLYNNGYIRVDGKPVEAPPVKPSLEVLIGELDFEYNQNLERVASAYVLASMKEDTTEMENLKVYLSELEENYNEAKLAIMEDYEGA